MGIDRWMQHSYPLPRVIKISQTGVPWGTMNSSTSTQMARISPTDTSSSCNTTSTELQYSPSSYSTIQDDKFHPEYEEPENVYERPPEVVGKKVGHWDTLKPKEAADFEMSLGNAKCEFRFETFFSCRNIDKNVALKIRSKLFLTQDNLGSIFMDPKSPLMGAHFYVIVPSFRISFLSRLLHYRLH